MTQLDRTEVPRFASVTVYEALGRAYRELGCFNDAVWAYRASAACDEGIGSMTIDAVRQLANLEARLAVNTQLKRRGTFLPEHPLKDTPAALFQQARKRADRLRGFQNTVETFEILGSLHKKRAATRTPGEQRTKELHASQDAYRMAMTTSLTVQQDLVLPPYSTCMWIQMSRLARPDANLVLQDELLTMLERQLQLKAVGKSLSAPRSIQTLIGKFEKADDSVSLLGQCLTDELSQKENVLPQPGAIRRSGKTADDFWIDAGLGDISITRAVFTQSDQFDGATEPYRTAFKNRSTVRERLSVLDHLRDLVALKPGQAAHVRNLEALISSLESAVQK